MSYTIQNDWQRKDALDSGSAGKVISGSHFFMEFTAIQNEFTTKAIKEGNKNQTFEALSPPNDQASDDKVVTTTYVQEELKRYLLDEGALLSVYPIGAIYTSTIDVVPSDLFGGTWASYGQGRVLIGAGTGIDSQGTPETMTFVGRGESSDSDTGGEYNHTLTEDEMPEHTHDINLKMDAAGSGAGGYVNYNSNATVPTEIAGGGLAHNNLPPYITVYMWERTA
jgi:hypothetical protein